MLVTNDGKIIQDINIDELSISIGKHYGKAITLYKDKITYRNTVSPTIAYMNFPTGYFDEKTISILIEQFNEISDAIYDAGLLNILKPISLIQEDLLPGANYQILNCTFDDGSQYEYKARSQPAKEFNEIANILNKYCSDLCY